jgi:hypothetical protein
MNKPKSSINSTMNKPKSSINSTMNKPKSSINSTMNKPKSSVNSNMNKPNYSQLQESKLNIILHPSGWLRWIFHSTYLTVQCPNTHYGRLYLYNRCLFMKYIVTFIIKSNVSAK